MQQVGVVGLQRIDKSSTRAEHFRGIDSDKRGQLQAKSTCEYIAMLSTYGFRQLGLRREELPRLSSVLTVAFVLSVATNASVLFVGTAGQESENRVETHDAGSVGLSSSMGSHVEVRHTSERTVFSASPGVFGYNHMAMLEWLPDRNTLVAAWQAARAMEGSASQVLFTSYSTDMGDTWSQPAKLLHDSPGILWSPVLHYVPESQKLLLFYSESTACLRPPKVDKAGVTVGEPRWNPGGDIKVAFSSDAGKTWVDSEMVYPQSADGGIPKVIANRVHVLRRSGNSTRFLLPFWRERARGAEITSDCPSLTGGGHETSGVLISDDLGLSWAPAGRIADPMGRTWLIEGTLAAAGNGDLLMLLRSTTDVVWASRSSDEGESWTVPTPLRLPNPNSKLSLIDLPDWGGTLLSALNFHPRLKGDHSRTRSHLSLATSVDGGLTWEVIAELKDDMRPGNWFHYPTVLQISREVVVVAYSAQYTADDSDGIHIVRVALGESSKGAARTSPLESLPGATYSASSTHPHCSAHAAGLYAPTSWCSLALDTNQWLQITLAEISNVTHIITGGRLDSRSDQRVTAYAVSFTTGGWKWEWYRGVLQEVPGVEELVLTGNKLQGGIQVNALTDSSGNTGILAKALRIHPVRWINHISMQVGLKVSAPSAKASTVHDEL